MPVEQPVISTAFETSPTAGTLPLPAQDLHLRAAGLEPLRLRVGALRAVDTAADLLRAPPAGLDLAPGEPDLRARHHAPGRGGLEAEARPAPAADPLRLYRQLDLRLRARLRAAVGAAARAAGRVRP